MNLTDEQRAVILAALSHYSTNRRAALDRVSARYCRHERIGNAGLAQSLHEQCRALNDELLVVNALIASDVFL
jgi:hypothetical protein